jgi:hypothetical protein
MNAAGLTSDYETNAIDEALRGTMGVHPAQSAGRIGLCTPGAGICQELAPGCSRFQARSQSILGSILGSARIFITGSAPTKLADGQEVIFEGVLERVE